MSAAQRQKVVYIFAGLIVAITLYVQFGVQVKPTLPEPVPTVAEVTIDPAAGIVPVVTGNAAMSQTTIVLAGSTSFDLKEGWGSDPFAPRNNRRHARERNNQQVAEAKSPADVWRLGGIIYLPSKPVAYVNDQPVHVGQIIDGATVTEITKNSVTLNVRGERKMLTLGKG